LICTHGGEVQRFIGRATRATSDRGEAADLLSYLQSLEDPVHGIWAVRRRITQLLAGVLLLKSIPASGELTPLQPSKDTEIGWRTSTRTTGATASRQRPPPPS